MKFPKLKNAGLCRLTPYVVVITPFILVGVLLWSFDFIPPAVAGFGCIGLVALLLLVIFKNFIVLMAMDFAFSDIYSNQRARKSFPINTTKKAILRRLSFLGRECQPTNLEPKPEMLRYKCSVSMTVYYKCIERMVAVYSSSYLDREEYNSMMRSAKANFKVLTGRKKPLLTDPSQKNAPICKCCFSVIIADSVDIGLSEELYKLVSSGNGDGEDSCILPCVIDLENRKCTFDSQKIPYCGFSYAAKSRVINMIARYVFGGRLPIKKSKDYIEPIYQDFYESDENTTVWEFWSKAYKELIGSEKEYKKLSASMTHGQVKEKDDFTYCKVNKRIVMLYTEYKDSSMVTVEEPDLWDYPKVNKISKNHLEFIKSQITEYYTSMGYKVKFEPLNIEDLE